MQLLSIAPADWRIRRKHVGGDGGRMNRSRRPHSFGKQGSGNLSNWGEHVPGPWIGKQQAGPYVSLCHKDALAYLPWQTGLPETINLARFIKIKQWPLTSPLSVRQMPRSNSIGLEHYSLSPFSLLPSVKHPKPESGRLREMVVGIVCLQQAESVFSSTVGETPLQVLSCSGWKKKHFHFTISLVVWCLQLAGGGSKGFCS